MNATSEISSPKSSVRHLPAKRFVTMKDIGRKLGLSDRAVSQALRETDGADSRVKVSPATRQRVQKMAAKMGYRCNTAAKALRTGRSGMFGILSFPGVLHFVVQQTYFASHEFRKAGITPLVLYGNSSPNGANAEIDALLDAGLDGVLIIKPMNTFTTGHVQRLKDAGVQVVTIGGPWLNNSSRYMPDIQGGFEMLTRHVLGQGPQSVILSCQNIPQDCNELLNWYTVAIHNGFKSAVHQAHKAGQSIKAGIHTISLDALQMQDDISVMDHVHPLYTSGYLSMWDLIKSDLVPEAFICQSDTRAEGALLACSEVGLRVPEDLVITGFNNDPSSSVGYTSLTTVQQPFEELCELAVAELLRLTRDQSESACKITIRPCNLIIRQSSHSQSRNCEVDSALQNFKSNLSEVKARPGAEKCPDLLADLVAQ